ncbi:hypothetical protein Dvina_50760 [Dactylosporangium vinaceum]|uniref:DUF6232 family protein n=1 Tax=Dactylosporangium vinaceum TaxID=53362 RepID=A0ABV5M4K7_9ACTN|nr:DUF6232 family protein [Dactylosporangium vinaceum]UAB96145.1 hypothetical protein Dvina_50760 [Dactylosporangium vinaceum]
MPIVFYKDHDIVITDDVYAVWKPEPQVYDLEALEDLHIEHCARPGRVAALAAGALATAGAAAALTITDGAGQFMIAAAVLSVPPLTGRAIRILTPVVWLLKANYAGAGVTLFSSTNVISILRVHRSLMRAFAANAASVERLDRTGYADAYRRLNSLL